MINNNSPALQASSPILSFGDADMHEGAMFSFERDLFGYLCLENIGDLLPLEVKMGQERNLMT